MGDAGFRGGLNTQTVEHYIDFCAEQGIEYHTLDGFDRAWYGGPIVPYQGADITRSVPEIDLPEVLSYAPATKGCVCACGCTGVRPRHR